MHAYYMENLGALETICEAYDKELTAEDVKYLYFARMYKFMGFTFRSKEKLGTAVFNADSKNDGTWWNRFFFVKVDSLGMPWNRFKFAEDGMFFLLFCFCRLFSM